MLGLRLGLSLAIVQHKTIWSYINSCGIAQGNLVMKYISTSHILSFFVSKMLISIQLKHQETESPNIGWRNMGMGRLRCGERRERAEGKEKCGTVWNNSLFTPPLRGRCEITTFSHRRWGTSWNNSIFTPPLGGRCEITGFSHRPGVKRLLFHTARGGVK